MRNEIHLLEITFNPSLGGNYSSWHKIILYVLTHSIHYHHQDMSHSFYSDARTSGKTYKYIYL